jgi:hypothetical protein
MSGGICNSSGALNIGSGSETYKPRDIRNCQA